MSDSSQTMMEVQKVESLLSGGSEFLQDDKLEKAKDCFEKALQINPESEKALGLLGLTHFRLSEFEPASGVYQRLVEMNANDASYRLNLGLVHLKLGRASLAIRELSKSKELDPSQLRTVSYLGLAHARNGEYAQAFEAFLRASESGLASEMEQYLEAEDMAAIRKRVEQGDSSPNSDKPSDSESILAEEAKSEAPMFPSQSDVGEQVSEVAESPAANVPPLSAEGVISRAVDVAAPSEDVALSDGTSQPGTLGQVSMSALSLREFTEQNRLRPEEGEETLGVGAGGALIAKVNGKLVSRTEGVMISSGELGFEPATRRIRGQQSDEVFGTGQAKLFLVTGKGYMVASASGEVFTVVSLDDEVLYLREEYLFSFEPQLRWENGRIPGSEYQIAQFRGDGCVAIRSPQALLSVLLSGERVLYVESDVLAGWTGKVVPRVVKPAAGGISSTSFVECSGEGAVLMHDLQDSK